jgi:hypothetical protein
MHSHSHSHSHPHTPPPTQPLSFLNFNYLGPFPRESPIGSTLPPSLPSNTPTMASTAPPIPRGAASKPRPMSLPPTSYSQSYSGTSSERPRQYVEQPLASAQRHSQRGLEPPKQRTTNRILGDYTLSKTLGAGSMGKVKLAHHNVTGEKVRTTLPLSFLSTFLHSRNVFSFLSPLVSVLNICRHDHSRRLRIVHHDRCCFPSLMVLSIAQTAHVPYPSYSHRGHDQSDIHPAPFFLPFAAIRFLILLCESCFVAVSMIHGR